MPTPPEPEDQTGPAIKLHYFRTEQEMDAFIEGAEWVNDSAIELTGSGKDQTAEKPNHPWLAIFEDKDYGPEDSESWTHPENPQPAIDQHRIDIEEHERYPDTWSCACKTVGGDIYDLATHVNEIIHAGSDR